MEKEPCYLNEHGIARKSGMCSFAFICVHVLEWYQAEHELVWRYAHGNH